MLPYTYLSQTKKTMLAYQPIRRDVIKQSGDALHHAKKAIFALHRSEKTIASDHLKKSKQLLTSILKKQKKSPQIMQEGALRAAIEEYVEALLFSQFLQGKELSEITTVFVPDDVYVAGLADVPGELYRYALQAGTKGDHEAVKRAAEYAEAIVESLIEFDLTKHLRNKFDQAKRSLHKIEQVLYELSRSV